MRTRHNDFLSLPPAFPFAPTLSLSLLLAVSMSQAANADDLQYRLGVGIGIKNASYDLIGTGNGTFVTLPDGSVLPGPDAGTVELDIDDDIYTATFNGAVVYDRFYVAAALELPVKTTDTTAITTFDSELLAMLPGAGTVEERDTEIDLLDFTLTFGYRVWKGLSVFSGYKYSELDFNSKEFNSLTNNKNQKYVEEGLFVGASYAWKVGKAGTLSMSVGYAVLDTELSEDNIDSAPPDFSISFQELAYSGSADGFSYGAQWTGQLTKRWLYTLSAKRQSYTSKNNATSLGVLVGDNFISQDPNISIPISSSDIAVTDLEAEHTDTLLAVGIQYVF